MCVCVCVCDISSRRVNGPSEPGRLRDVCVCQWVKFVYTLQSSDNFIKEFLSLLTFLQ